MNKELERSIRRHLEDIETELREAGMDRTARDLRRAILTLEGVLDEALARGRREGFEAAREGYYANGMNYYNADEGIYAALAGCFKYASLEHYEKTLKEKEGHGG